jgi:predicted esterase YcpF (UPF0227 family)
MGTSLGGFYANYVRALNQSEQIKVHAINPSWSPSSNLKKEVNKSHNNLKTNENWTFTDAHLNYLAHFEKECLENLKHYSKAHYSLHIANFDEVLTFDTMFDYLKENNVPNKPYYYNTNHRFEVVNDLLENIKNEWDNIIDLLGYNNCKINDNPNNWVIHEGFHSWKKRPVCRWMINKGHHRIFKFIIPKGATYYEGIQHDDEIGYVSDKIIMKNCAYYTGFWSFLNNFLVR